MCAINWYTALIRFSPSSNSRYSFKTIAGTKDRDRIQQSQDMHMLNLSSGPDVERIFVHRLL